MLSGFGFGQTYTFTNAGATGREGPEQSDINSAYLGTNLESKVTINARGIQEWTVPASGTYRIEAWGASGGNSGSNGNGNGGRGAKVNGNFTLQKNSILRLIIGQQGLSAPYEAGGGGDQVGEYENEAPAVDVRNQSVPQFAAGHWHSDAEVVRRRGRI